MIFTSAKKPCAKFCMLTSMFLRAYDIDAKCRDKSTSPHRITGTQEHSSYAASPFLHYLETIFSSQFFFKLHF